MACNNCAALIPAFLGLFGVWLSLSGTFWCETFKIEPINSNLPTLYTGLVLVKTVGVAVDGGSNQVTVYNTCEEFYGDFSIDTKWNAAFWLQVVSWIVGLAATIALFVSACTGSSKNCNYLTGLVFFFINVFFTGMIFLALKSNLCTDNPLLLDLQAAALYRNECKVGPGSTLMYIAIVFFLAAALSSCWLPGTEETEAAADEPPAQAKDQVQQDQQANLNKGDDVDRVVIEEVAVADDGPTGEKAHAY